MNPKEKLRAIPTNIITGFLGVGKTTAISHLLKQKKPNERWAILVNEFGEVGIDGSLFKCEEKNDQDIFISEVPGGCMCCAAGLPMQMALNMLLKRARPDRLLIEPTGLGHPKEVMAVLSAAHYQDVLALHSTITLVDARKLADTRYTQNDTFNQQLDIADVIVANKADLYATEDLLQLIDYLGGRFKDEYKPIFPVRYGALETAWLDGPAFSAVANKSNNASSAVDSPPLHQLREELSFSNSGYVTITNEGEGFFSQGWVFKPDMIFDRKKLSTVMLGINAERVKGVFITQQGIISFNVADDVLTEITLDNSMDSRIEVIAEDTSQFHGLEQQLLSCMH